MLGNWHLPVYDDHSSKREVSGDVVFDHVTGWKLTLHGSLQQSQALLNMPPRQPVIWGETLDGKKVSLFDGICERKQFRPGDRRDTEEWIGLHYSIGTINVDLDTLISRVQIRIDALEEWAFWSAGIDYDYDRNTIEIPDDIFLSANVRGSQVRLSCMWNVTDSFRSASTTRKASFSIVDVVSIRDLQPKWIAPLQGLLSFLALGYTAVTGTTVRSLDTDDTIVLHFLPPRQPSSNSSWHPSFMLLAHNDLDSYELDIEALLCNWFELSDSHRTAVDIVRFLDTNPSVEPSVTLLMLFTAIEAVHRSEFDEMIIPQDQHRRRVRSIVAVAPDEHKQWVKDRLYSSNRKGLMRKLREVNSLAECTRLTILSVWPKFERDVIKQRNKVAHPSETNPEDTRRALATRMGLLWILRHIFLTKLGLSSDEAGEVVARNQDFLRECQILDHWSRQE